MVAELTQLSVSDMSSLDDDSLRQNSDKSHKLVNVKPLTNGTDSLDNPKSGDSGTINRATLTRREEPMPDVPLIDAGVRMLCMDGGGAKGVIEATILDKIFCSVAVTLKYEVHVMNWITLVIDRDVKEKEGVEKRLENIYQHLLNIINDPDKEDTIKATKMYQRVQQVDRTKDLTEKKLCVVISGLVDEDRLFTPLAHQQKIKILRNEALRKIPGLEVKDFLHGAAKYWVLLDSDHSEEAREAIKADVLPAFDSKSKCISMLMPADSLVLRKTEENVAKLEKRDLFVFYWEQPVKTKHALDIKESLMGLTDSAYKEKYNPSVFMEEIQASELFDLLIGTSTGSILAFGMGYKGLSPQECRDVYLKSIKKIFSLKYDRSTTRKIGLGDSVFRLVGDLVGQGHYSIEGVSDTLEHNYNEGRPTRTLMGEGEHRTACICACVALNWDEQNLEVFDTHNPRYKDWDLIQFLTASSDAPVYFTTPFEVKGPNGTTTNYIDGGLGANCPAKQGIELSKKRWPGADIELILSLGAGKDKHPPEVPKTGGDWLKTLCSMVTDGDHIWQNFVIPMLSIDGACKNTEYLRIQPKLELALFKADSTKVIEMCNLAEVWLNTSTGFDQVTEACGKIIAKSMKLTVESRILTERDLLDWIASTLPIGKTLFKNKMKTNIDGGCDDHGQGITNDALDMKFGRELHTLYVAPCTKLYSRIPAIDSNFIYIPKPVSVDQTDLRFTLRFDQHTDRGYDADRGQQILKLHCPDNHEVKIIANLDLFETDKVFKISQLCTVPLEETEQFHRLVHEASKEISQLHEDDRNAAEDKLCKAMELTDLRGFEEIKERYKSEHFMRVQAYFYLWKRTTTEVSLYALNETLIQVGMKKRPWPKRGKLGYPDVTVRTVIPAPPENMMFGIAAEYFNDRLEKAVVRNNKKDIERYSEFLKHLGVHPAKKKSETARYKKKFFGTVFKKRKEAGSGAQSQSTTGIRGKKKVTREQQYGGEYAKRSNKSIFRKTQNFFGKNKSQNVPRKYNRQISYPGPHTGTIPELSIRERSRTHVKITEEEAGCS